MLRAEADPPPYRTPSEERRAESGVASERTALAWMRSALAMTAIGALFLRFGSESGLPAVGYPLGAVVLLAAVAIWFLGSRGYHANLEAIQEGRVAPRVQVLKFIAIGTTVLGVIAFGMALLS